MDNIRHAIIGCIQNNVRVNETYLFQKYICKKQLTMKRILTLCILSILLFAAGSSYAQSKSGDDKKKKSAHKHKHKKAKHKKPAVEKSRGRQNDHHRRHETYEPRFTMAFKGGFNGQRMGGNDPNFDSWIKPGWLAGMYVHYEKRIFGFQTEGIYKTCRYYIRKDAALYIRTKQVDFPVLLTVRPLGIAPVLDRIKFVVGPQFSFMVDAVKANRINVKNNFTNADVAATLGLELDLPLNISLGIRGLYGLANVNNTKPGHDWFNSSVQATLALRLLN